MFLVSCALTYSLLASMAFPRVEILKAKHWVDILAWKLAELAFRLALVLGCLHWGKRVVQRVQCSLLAPCIEDCSQSLKSNNLFLCFALLPLLYNSGDLMEMDSHIWVPGQGVCESPQLSPTVIELKSIKVDRPIDLYKTLFWLVGRLVGWLVCWLGDLSKLPNLPFEFSHLWKWS